MVTVSLEERVTRLETLEEANARQLAEVLSRLDRVLVIVEATRQESREMIEAARKESREINEANRQESREMNEATRKEMREISEANRQESREMIEAARKESRTFFVSIISIGAALTAAAIGTGIGTLIAVLDRATG